MFARQCRPSGSTILRVSSVGDGDAHERVVSVLVDEANKAFRFCADRPAEELIDEVLSPTDLWSVMWDAAGKGGEDPERVSAAAALTLIHERRQVFKDYPKLPQPCPETSGRNFLSGFARQLAQGAASRLVTDWPDNEAASYQMLKVLTEITEAAERGNFQWDNAEERVVTALQEYRLPAAELWAKVIPPDEDDADDDADEIARQGDGLDENGAGEDADPDISDQTSRSSLLGMPGQPAPSGGHADGPVHSKGVGSRPQPAAAWRKVLLAVTALSIGATVAVAVVLARPSLAGLQDQGQSASVDPPVDRYVIPPLPPGDRQLFSPNALPNTTVQLFLMSNGPDPVAQSQTTNGVLPTVSAYPMSTTTVNATFQVWLSVANEEYPVDRDLRMWINATAPMVVHDATLMDTPRHEGPPRPEMNSVVTDVEGSDPQVDGGKAVAVEALPSSKDRAVIYQFQVRARPQESSNDYPCGFTAASVTVAVQVGTDSRKAVATPYPLYVPGGEDC